MRQRESEIEKEIVTKGINIDRVSEIEEKKRQINRKRRKIKRERKNERQIERDRGGIDFLSPILFLNCHMEATCIVLLIPKNMSRLHSRIKLK